LIDSGLFQFLQLWSFDQNFSKHIKDFQVRVSQPPGREPATGRGKEFNLKYFLCESAFSAVTAITTKRGISSLLACFTTCLQFIKLIQELGSTF
jgi:hypothetical protein